MRLRDTLVVRKKSLIVSLVLLVSLAGCVSIPQEELSPAIGAQELSDHVHFLAQPALKGRKPKTRQSATVRRYRKERFAAYGLVPWPGEKGYEDASVISTSEAPSSHVKAGSAIRKTSFDAGLYEQSFGLGTNVIGILPGSDPNLVNEIVILAAHYDHLGKHKKDIYHGASDNASGVAVLLEIAEQLSMAKQKPKRSVCFAAFDCEEQLGLGSFAFTCREDVEETDIVAVVNVDTLGRDFFDVVENTLMAVGTMRYPRLRQQITDAGDGMGIDVAVIGSDFVGPRGDHVPFETMPIPCLFFTSGPYSDYHMPTDTADKLNYAKLKRSAGVICTSVCHLANAPTVEQPAAQNSGDIQEMETLKLNFAKIVENREKAGLTEEQAEQIAELCTEADRLLSKDQYTLQDRQAFLWKAVSVFVPLTTGPDAADTTADSNEAKIAAKYGMPMLAMLYADRRTALIEGARKFVKHLLKHKPGLFNNIPRFEHTIYEPNDAEISFAMQKDGEYLLAVLQTRLTISGEVSGWLFFKRTSFSLSWPCSLENCRGTRQQIIDFCLLQLADNPEDKDHIKVWQKVLSVVAPAQLAQTYDEWIRWRLDSSRWKTEEEWLLDLMQSENPYLAAEAVASAKRIASEDAEDILRNIVLDDRARAFVRARAISTLTKDAGPEAMMALVDVVDNSTPSHSREDLLYMNESYPFYDHPAIQWARESTDNQLKEKAESMKIGNRATEKLRELTDEDFGTDKEAWRKWIKANVK